MNPANVPITYLKGAAPPGPVIRASELALYFDAASILAQAASQAEALIARANETVADATREADRIRAQAREQGLAEASAEMEALRASLIDETIQWCVDESSLETAIVVRLDTQIRGVVGETLATFATEQDALERLMRKVGARLRECTAQPRTTLRVAGHALDAARNAFAAEEHGHRVEVVVDTTLKATQAVIETPFVKICIDLDLHLHSVLSRLRGMGNEDVCHAR